MMKRTLPRLTLAAALVSALSGCITFRTVDDGITRARIGQTVQVGGISVMPTRVVEDSRCPADVQCVWAGRVRLAATVNGAPSELTLGVPASVAGAALTLVEVYPAARKDTTYYPDEYRFGFSARR